VGKRSGRPKKEAFIGERLGSKSIGHERGLFCGSQRGKKKCMIVKDRPEGEGQERREEQERAAAFERMYKLPEGPGG